MYVLPQLKHPDGGRELCPGLRQRRTRSQLWIEFDQTIIDLLDDPAGRGVVGQTGIERSRVDVDADAKGSPAGCRPSRERDTQGSGQQYEKRMTQLSPDHVVPPSSKRRD